MKRAWSLAILVAAAAVAWTPAEAAPPAPAPSHGAKAARPRLVFFMNPNGRPCQVQDQILREMGGELTGRADLVYVRTTEPGDIRWFQQYGIRSLPMLVLADGSGKELRRATPGIQAAPQVLQLIGP